MALTGSLANLYTTEYSLYSDEIFSLSSLVLTHMRLSKQTFKSTIDNFIWLAILFSFWLVFASSVLWPFLVTKYYMEWTESFYQQKVSGWRRKIKTFKWNRNSQIARPPEHFEIIWILLRRETLFLSHRVSNFKYTYFWFEL